MNTTELASKIIDGLRLSRNDNLSFFKDCDLSELTNAADKIRAHFMGNNVDLCTIINGRSGRCGENCKFCAQSAHNHTGCEEYSFMDEEKIIAEARKTAADILNAAKTEGDKIAGAAGSAPVDDTIFEDVVTEAAGTEEAKGESKLKMAGGDSATSKFFQQSNEDVFGDGDDVFVGEIEDNRKSNKVMIGDGEEEGADDFEFL